MFAFSNIFCSFLFIYAITESIHIESSYVLLYTLQQQLQALLEALNTTEPHYIRCVKPNNLLKPSVFENHNVLQQLCCGVRKCLEFFHIGGISVNWKFVLTSFFSVGSDGSNKNKLCRISYSKTLLWIFRSLWRPLAWSFRWKVPILPCTLWSDCQWFLILSY